jgi:selenocysteine lyase/cysteine desulfurase
MNQLIEKIRTEMLSQRVAISTPFGLKPLVYADYTASGRSLGFIEEYLQAQVLPFYANTHTETNCTGATTTAWRESARCMIKGAVNGSANDRVIFCGSGATAAVNKLIDLLNLRLPAEPAMRAEMLRIVPEHERPVVLLGPYEHHSNELPWRESIAVIEMIGLTSDGEIDSAALELALQRNQHRKLLIGSFSAASNVTGIKTDVAAVTRLLKAYGALACWDYAAAGPYVAIDMNARDALDAVFLSPHKFVGGPGTPGVLIAKTQVFRNLIPSIVGGGTVSYVSPDDHVYVKDLERREEAGTPAIVESIRAGMVVALRQQVGLDLIHELEDDMARRAMKRLLNCQGVEVLGSHKADRLPIFSLRFMHKNRELHYGFVVALLNDLFGIQARGGCSCAGPYAHHLLAMDKHYSKRIEAAVISGAAIMRPGWVRLSFNYFIDADEFDYILSAVELVAEFGWRLLPAYFYDTEAGVWRHKGSTVMHRDPMPDIDWQLPPPPRPQRFEPALPAELQKCRLVLQDFYNEDRPEAMVFGAEHEALRWFVTPAEVNCN